MSDLVVSNVGNVVYEVPAHLIVVGNNQRLEGNTGFTDQSLKALADSIGEDGLTNPITVTAVPTCACDEPEDDGGGRCVNCQTEMGISYLLIAGERRYRAITKFLNWATIPAFVREMDHVQQRSVMAHENIGRVDLNPIEEALVFEEFTTIHKLTNPETAARCGTTLANVVSRLKLLKLIPEAREMVARGQLPVTHADAMTDLPEDLQREALKLLGRASPTFVQFKQYLVQLQSEQYQQFDLTSMWADLVQQGAEQQAAMRGGAAELVTSDALPPVRADRKDTAGDIMVRYMWDLAEAGHQDAAAAVGNLMQVMLQFRKVKNFRENPQFNPNS